MQITKKTTGVVLLQTISTITEKEQLLHNTHNGTICQIIFMSLHQLGTERQKNANFTQKLILDILDILAQLPNINGFIKLKTKCQSICHSNYIENSLVIEAISVRFPRNP